MKIHHRMKNYIIKKQNGNKLEIVNILKINLKR